jgi:hypothetical protein
MPTLITRLDTIIEGLKGKILGITFTKKDGSVRNINGIYGVNRALKGGEFKGDPNTYIVIYDLNKRDYRSVNRFTISEVRYGRYVYRKGGYLQDPGVPGQEDQAQI